MTPPKFEVAQAVNFADLANQAKLQAKFSQLQSQYNNYFNEFFIYGKEFTLHHLDWRGLIIGNYLKKILIGLFGYTWYVLNETAITWYVLNETAITWYVLNETAITYSASLTYTD